MLTIDAVHLREINMPLAFPFETSFGLTTTRRILLVEIESGGMTAWGECVAGEHPYFSDECIDTAWIITETELAPRLVGKELASSGSCPDLFRQVRGHRMAKAALENAVWELEAQKKRLPLAKLLGGTRSVIPCGVSIGIQPSPAALMEKIAEELEAGYQRIKLKCKPGWDTKIFEAVRARWPEILLSCDANSAYRIVDFDHIVEWDRFKLLMIEQPLWYDDFYFHSMLQKRLRRRSAWTNRSATGAMRWPPSPCSRAASSTSRWAAWAVSPRRSRCITRRRSAASRCGAAGCWSRASGGRTTSRSLRWRTSRCPGTCRRRRATGPRTSSSRR